MKKLSLIILTASLFARNEPAKETSTTQDDTTAQTEVIPVEPARPSYVEDTIINNEDHETFYLTIVDTGRDYYVLDKQMYELSTALKIQIDTMNRHYNKEKNEIVLPDDDEDEMYRGAYYPRRYGPDFLSLEHFYAFTNRDITNESFALIAGIYESRTGADSMLNVIKAKAPKAYVLKTSLYIGCMH